MVASFVGLDSFELGWGNTLPMLKPREVDQISPEQARKACLCLSAILSSTQGRSCLLNWVKSRCIIETEAHRGQDDFSGLKAGNGSPVTDFEFRISFLFLISTSF